MLRKCLVALLAFGLCSCSSNSNSDDVSVPDDVVADSRQPTDILATDDVVGDAAPADVPVEECEPVSQGTLLSPDSGSRKFALSLFHYNLQYVAGGLIGFMDKPETDLTDIEVQDRIIVESFFPMIEILENHPTWGMDAEMQGMMVEAIFDRHSEMLPRIRALIERGQLHVDSFHYSDQLWVAYPYPSMERSFQLNEEVFAQACLPQGGAVFTQEGQFGHGMAHHIKDSGRVALYPTNLFKYYSGSDPGALAYDWDGTPVVLAGKSVAEEVSGETVEVTWHFMNDGELAFTGNANPYFGTLFAYDKKSTQKYVEKLEQMEADGWTIATVADYVAHLEAMGYQKPAMPLALDGAWQPKDTQNIFRWMGQVGELGGPEEDDNLVLTTNVKSRMLLQAVEGLVDGWTESREAWVHQLSAEVSDSTGWNPWPGEVTYSLEHAASASTLAWAALESTLTAGDVWVDTSGKAGGEEELFYYTASPDQGVVFQPGATEVLEAPPVDVDLEATGRDIDAVWSSTSLPDVYLLEVNFSAGALEDDRFIRVTFPRTGDTLRYVPALMEAEGTVTDFDVTNFALDETQYLAIGLANGLLGLGGDAWLIKVESTMHLAAIIPKTLPHVRFESHCQPVADGGSWSFLYLANATAEEALALADRVNVQPVIKIVAP